MIQPETPPPGRGPDHSLDHGYQRHGLLVSGMAILLADPHLYWGETGGVGTSSLLDLPLPFLSFPLMNHKFAAEPSADSVVVGFVLYRP